MKLPSLLEVQNTSEKFNLDRNRNILYSIIRHCLLSFIIFSIFIPSYLYSSDENESQAILKTESQTIIVVSDTQSPLWVEELVLSSNNNEKARSIIFERIIEAQPDAVFHLGDLVSLGFYDGSWEAIDEFLNKLAQFQIPFYPTLGNHELMFFSDKGEENFMSRFPFYSKTGYLKRFGPLAMILLNSNFSDLTDEEIDKQHEWYRAQLNYCDTDSSIKAVIVGCHHPPYTNSKIVHSDKDVQKYFVEDFLKSDKTKLFLSGHSHSFEHFSRAGKDFFNIGGGGGLHHPLYRGNEAIHDDLYQGNMSKRSFHFLQGHFTHNRLILEIKMLTIDLSEINTIYTVKYNFSDQLVVETR